MNHTRAILHPVSPDVAIFLATLTSKQRIILGFKTGYPQSYIERGAFGKPVPSYMGWRWDYWRRNRSALDQWPSFQ